MKPGPDPRSRAVMHPEAYQLVENRRLAFWLRSRTPSTAPHALQVSERSLDKPALHERGSETPRRGAGVVARSLEEVHPAAESHFGLGRRVPSSSYSSLIGHERAPDSSAAIQHELGSQRDEGTVSRTAAGPPEFLELYGRPVRDRVLNPRSVSGWSGQPGLSVSPSVHAKVRASEPNGREHRPAHNLWGASEPNGREHSPEGHDRPGARGGVSRTAARTVPGQSPSFHNSKVLAGTNLNSNTIIISQPFGIHYTPKQIGGDPAAQISGNSVIHT